MRPTPRAGRPLSGFGNDGFVWQTGEGVRIEHPEQPYLIVLSDSPKGPEVTAQ